MFFVWLGIFAIVGVGLRYLASTQILYSGFPVATLLVNVVGSFAIGFLYAWQTRDEAMAANPIYLAIGIGLLGALTTFSSFSIETIRLFQANAFALGALNILLTNGLSIGFCYAGVKLGH